ncbi:MAG: hypothetical protein V7636_1367, partial [Actinomycetota bacterium]
MIRRVGAVALVAVFLLPAACGRGDSGIGVRPVSVADDLVPGAIGGGLKLYESRTKETRNAFANAGDESLVADGRVWEIRKGARLVGAL